jgi:ornithine cyclodeaminase
MRTLLLTRSDVEALLDPPSLVEPLRAGFIAYSASASGRAQRVRAPLPGPSSATVLFPGIALGVPAYTVKVHAKFPGEDPAIRGVLCLHDVAKGDLLAVMDSTHLTAVRTGLAGALAAHVLARSDGVTAAERASVYDIAPERAEAFARAMRSELHTPVEAASSVATAVREADIVLVATWSKTPFIVPGMLAAGTHVTTLGPDEPGKAEVDANVIREGLFVCDDRALAVELGALCGIGLGDDHVDAEFGDVLAGTHPGRTSADQITIYGGVGLAFQDAIAAWQVYEAAKARGVGRAIDFLA